MKRPAIVAQLAELVRRIALGDINPSGLVADLRELADAIEGKGAGAEPIGPKSQEMLDTWKRIFNYWQAATGKNRARPSRDKREKVYARLRAGFSEAEIRKAIDGCVSDEWHVEKQKFDLVYICQSDTKLEGFIERAGGMPDRPERMLPDAVQAQIDSLEQKAMDALDRGDDETYEAVQQQIARIQRVGE
ncbi:MAG TPA: hypothetical protein ENK57_12170 [Polyangiaceae bacterium]|nr:hypothetical protein [Polyangiaceae bacterium]